MDLIQETSKQVGSSHTTPLLRTVVKEADRKPGLDLH